MRHRTRVRTLEQRLHELMERTGAHDFRITSSRSHWRSSRHFELELDLHRGGEKPEWKRFGYVHNDEWKWDGFTGALELLIADAEQEFELQVARVATERAAESREALAERGMTDPHPRRTI